MAFLKAESKIYQHVQALVSLHVINTLNRAVEKRCFAKISFGETIYLNGYNQHIDHVQWRKGLHVLIELALSFQKHHHSSLYLSVSRRGIPCRDTRFGEIVSNSPCFEAFSPNLASRQSWVLCAMDRYRDEWWRFWKLRASPISTRKPWRYCMWSICWLEPLR